MWKETIGKSTGTYPNGRGACGARVCQLRSGANLSSICMPQAINGFLDSSGKLDIP